mgnify:CR=1 FL=1
MSNKTEQFKYLEGYIGVGKSNAKSQKALAEDMGVTSQTVKHVITEARRAGVLIASNTRGYYYAETVEEMREFANMLRTQGKTRFDTAKPFLEAINELKKE